MFDKSSGIRSFGLQVAERVLPTMLRVAREDSSMEAKTAELVRTHTLPKGEEDWGRRLMTQGIAGTDLPTYLLDSGPHNGPLLSRSDSASPIPEKSAAFCIEGVSLAFLTA